MGFFDNMVSNVRNITRATIGVAKDATGAANGVVRGAISGLADIGAAIKDGAIEAGKDAAKTVERVADGVVDTVKTGIDATGKVAAGVVKTGINATGKVADGVVNTVKTGINATGKVADGVVNTVMIGTVGVDFTSKEAESIFDNIKADINAAGNVTSGIVDGAKAGIKTITKGVDTKSFISSIKNAVRNISGGILTGTHDVLGKIVGEETADKYMDTVHRGADGFRSFIDTASKPVKNILEHFGYDHNMIYVNPEVIEAADSGFEIKDDDDSFDLVGAVAQAEAKSEPGSYVKFGGDEKCGEYQNISARFDAGVSEDKDDSPSIGV